MSNVIYENMLPDGSRLIQDEKIVASKHFPISITTFLLRLMWLRQINDL